MDVAHEVREKVELIRAQIADAARRSGRAPESVRLVGVSKYASPNDGIVEAMLRAGLYDLAENRPQRLLEKVDVWGGTYDGRFVPTEALASDSPLRNDPNVRLRWHFIGSLQRNKARRILPCAALIHSVDSLKLLEAIDRILEEEASKEHNGVFPKVARVLLEAHISEDENKQGFACDEIANALQVALAMKRVVVCGLMGMAGLNATESETRRQFAKLRQTLVECQERFPEATNFKELSMGMSGDFEIAIEEGASIVRIGSSLYPS